MKINKAILKELGWIQDKKKHIYYYPDSNTSAWIEDTKVEQYNLSFIVSMMLIEHTKRCKRQVITAVSNVIIQ